MTISRIYAKKTFYKCSTMNYLAIFFEFLRKYRQHILSSCPYKKKKKIV